MVVVIYFLFFAHTKCDWKLNIFKTNDRSVFTLFPFESSPSSIIMCVIGKEPKWLRSTKKDIVVE